MRAGNKIYKGVEIPFSANPFFTKTGRECYYLARFIDDESGIEKAKVRFLDTMEIRVVDWLLINKYIK
jgi:hypothetical protein